MDENHDETDTKGGEARGGSSLRELSTFDFAMLGDGEWAYVRPVVVNGERAFAIHGAAGDMLQMVKDREVAMATARQNEYEPFSVH